MCYFKISAKDFKYNVTEKEKVKVILSWNLK